MFTLTPFATKNPSIFDYFDVFDQNFQLPSQQTYVQFRADVEESDSAYILSAELPGFNKEEIQIDFKEDVLTITATHEERAEETKDADQNSDEHVTKFIRKERSSCNFKRSFHVDDIDTTGIKAHYNNGILNVTLPKCAPTEPERITIDVA